MKSSQNSKRVVDLCIYVDNNAYDPNVDKEILFDSLYTIVLKIALNHKVLPRYEDYPDFALFAATRLYMRLINPKQFLPDDDPKKLKRVKSILNMLKATMHPMVVDYQQTTYAQRFGVDDNKYISTCAEDIRAQLNTKARKNTTPFLQVEYEYYLKKLTVTIKNFIKTTPYAKDKLMSHKLYMSCLITILNQITLNNFNKERLFKKQNGGYKLDTFIDTIYQTEKEHSVVLFHLDESMYNYIQTLVNRIRTLIVKDLRDIVGSHEPSDSVIKAIISGGQENYAEE